MSALGLSEPASRCKLLAPGEGVEDTPRLAWPVVVRPSSRAVAQSRIQERNTPSSISASVLPATPSPSKGCERSPRLRRGSAMMRMPPANSVSPISSRKKLVLRDKMGEKLFAGGIRIIDDPLRKRGLRSHPFDGEGVAGKTLALIDDGVLRSWILDCATARELGLTTTGHASRGVSSTPSPGASNLHLEPGKLSPEELIADIKDGFYVTDLIGMGVNMVTGDYSRGASGFWIEDGQRTFAVSEVTIAGHLLDIFKNLTPASDLEFRHGINAPTVRLEGLTVAGQ